MQKTLNICREHNIKVSPFKTLSSLRWQVGGSLDKIVERIAAAKRATNEQVLLSWALQVSGGPVVTWVYDSFTTISDWDWEYSVLLRTLEGWLGVLRWLVLSSHCWWIRSWTRLLNMERSWIINGGLMSTLSKRRLSDNAFWVWEYKHIGYQVSAWRWRATWKTVGFSDPIFI